MGHWEKIHYLKETPLEMGPVETQITFTTSLPITRNTLSSFQIQANNSAKKSQQKKQ
jgi:hypothetical protein